MYVIEGSYFNEIKIKGSLFKTSTFEANNLIEIKKILSLLENKFSDASHICYGYRICDYTQLDLFYNPTIIEFSTDDGEPSGTAGKSILNILKQKNIINRIIFVVRYFGGTKLGIPGLIEAYKSSSELVLENVQYKKWLLLKKINLELDYSYHKIIKNIIHKHEGRVLDSIFSGNISLKITIPYKNFDKFKENIIEKSKGTIKVIE